MATGTLDERVRALALQHGISPEAASRMLKDKLGIGIFNQLTASTVDPRRQSNRRPMQYPRAPTDPSYTGGGVQGSSGWGSGVREWGQGIGNQMREMVGIEPAGGKVDDPNMGAAGSEGFGEYGGVPLGVRLATLGGILSNYGNFDPRMLSPLVAAREAKAAQAEQQRKQQMADRIADNLQDTNPQLADAIRMNPALVEDYAKGQIDLEKTLQIDASKEDYNIADDEREAAAALKLEGVKQTGDRELKQMEIDNDPKRVAQREWIETIKTFQSDSGLEKSGTVELWKQYTGDDSLTETEAKALASSKTEDDMWNKYNQMVDNRTKKKEVEATSSAAALAGIKVPEGQYIVNAKEILTATAAGTDPPAPVLAYAEGTKGKAEMDATESAAGSKAKNTYMAADATVGAIDRALAGISRQESGESSTGVGISSIVGGFPIPSEAGNIYDEFNTIRANLGFEQLQKMRDQSPTGGALGPVSDYENRLLQSTVESLNQGRDPEILKGRLNRLRVRYADVMTASPVDPSKSVMKVNVELLQKDPSPEARAEFDEVYGEGAAATILGQ